MKKLAALPALLVLAGCAGATDLGPAPKAKSQAAAKLNSASPTTEQKLVPLKIWLVQGKGLVQRNRAHPQTVRVATAALQELLAGPTQGEWNRSGITTSIPVGTRLLGVDIDNGVATVDLASEFQAGAGSGSLQLRLAQVVYTLTQFPTVRKVRFELDGAPVNVLSNRGVVVDRPVARRDYGKTDCAGFPSSQQGFIQINSPSPGARISGGGSKGSPVVVRGCSSTFEGTLNWDLKTKDGVTISAGVAQGGSLRPGPFRFTIPPPSVGEGLAVLQVYEPPASGEGGPTSRASVPVVLQKAREATR
jgi:germination protein M